MHAEMETLVVQRSNRVAGHLIRQFANRFSHQIVRLRQFAGSETAGYTHGGRWVQIKNDAPFDVTRYRNERGNSLAAVDLFVHAEVSNRRRRLESLRQHRIRGVNEGLN